MSSLSLRLLVVVGLAAGLASTGCTEQSSEEIEEAQEQKVERKTERKSEQESEDMSGDQQPAPPLPAEREEISEEERRELEGWMNEKLREGQEHEAQAEREGK